MAVRKHREGGEGVGGQALSGFLKKKLLIYFPYLPSHGEGLFSLTFGVLFSTSLGMPA